jgi:hypothetical protein
MRPYKLFVLALFIFTGGVLFLSHPGLIKQGLAADADKSPASAQGEKFVVSGIFYDEDNPRVLINEELFSLNSSCCGGKITGIFNDYIVLEFPYGSREYRLGDVIRKEKVKVQPRKITPGPASGIPPSYVKKVNAIVESFMASHSQHNAALDIRSFVSPDEADKIRARAKLMMQLIRKKKEQLSGLSVPDDCKRHYSLAIKLFDIAEDGWKALLSGEKDEAEVFFSRLTRVSQEISRESVSILAR